MSYPIQAFLLGIAVGAVFGFVFGRARGFTEGQRDGWDLAQRLLGNKRSGT